MAPKINPADLCPELKIKTDVPFPHFVDNSEIKPVEKPHASDTVHITTTSELVNYQAPGSIFGSTSKMLLLHDELGHPLTLSVGSDQKLYVLVFVNGAQGRWQAYDITPRAGLPVVAVDAIIIGTEVKKLVITAAQDMEPTGSTIFHMVVDLPKLSASASGEVTGFNIKDGVWISIDNFLGAERVPITKKITGLNCARAVPDDEVEYYYETKEKPLFKIVVSTDSSSTHEASHYYVEPTPNAAIPWELVMLPKSAARVIGCQPAIPNNMDRSGYYVLTRSDDDEQTYSCVMRAAEFSKDIILHKIGKPLGVCSSVNRRGYTDVLFPTEAGIAFYDHRNSLSPHTVLLPEVSFKDVVCSEEAAAEEPSVSDITIFGLSTSGSLYFITGTRTNGPTNKGVDIGAVLNFSYSGIPIRTGVNAISARQNPITRVSELLFTLDGQQELRHLCRDPKSSFWTENKLTIAATLKNPDMLKYMAFMTSLSLGNQSGKPVPAGYPVELSTTREPVHALVNGKTFIITRNPQPVQADKAGMINVVIPADGVSCSGLKFRLSKFTDKPKTIVIEPTRKVTGILGSIQTVDDFKNATDGQGKSVLGNRNLDKESLEGAVEMFKAIPEVGKADGESNSTVPAGMSWDNFDNFGHFLGDVLQVLKAGVKFAVKTTVKVVGKALVFVIRIAAKAYRVIANTISTVVTCIVNVLEDLGLDLSALKEWFAFHFQKTSKMQEALAYSFTCAIKLGDRFLAANRESLVNGLDHMEGVLESIVCKPAQHSLGSCDDEPSFLQKFLSHPIVKVILDANPLEWIMEGFQEGLEESGILDEIIIPTIPGINTAKELFTFITRQISRIYGLFLQIIQNIATAVTNPAKAKDAMMDTLRSVAWSAWESIKDLILQLFDMITNFFHDVGEFILGEWKLPPLTDIWEDLTGLKFTIVNVFTYVMANVLGIITIGSDVPLITVKDFKFMDPANISDQKLKIFNIPPRNHKAHEVESAMPAVATGDLKVSSASVFSLSTRDLEKKAAINKSSDWAEIEPPTGKSSDQKDGNSSDKKSSKKLQFVKTVIRTLEGGARSMALLSQYACADNMAKARIAEIGEAQRQQRAQELLDRLNGLQDDYDRETLLEDEGMTRLEARLNTEHERAVTRAVFEWNRLPAATRGPIPTHKNIQVSEEVMRNFRVEVETLRQRVATIEHNFHLTSEQHVELLNQVDQTLAPKKEAMEMAKLCAGFNGFAVVTKILVLFIVTLGEEAEASEKGSLGADALVGILSVVLQLIESIPAEYRLGLGNMLINISSFTTQLTGTENMTAGEWSRFGGSVGATLGALAGMAPNDGTIVPLVRLIMGIAAASGPFVYGALEFTRLG